MVTTARVIKFPHGDTFDPTLTYKQEKVAQDISAFTITSQVRKFDGSLVATLSVTKTAPALGQFTTVGQTSSWPENENLYWDVQFDNGGVIKSMPRVVLHAESDVTE